MFEQEHLTLRLIRLRAPEEWRHRAGLSFLFPKGGAGTYLGGRLTQRLAPGDVAVLNGDQGGRVCVAKGQEMLFWFFSLSLEHLFPLFATNEISLLQTVLEGLKGLKLHPASGGLAAECHRLIGDLPPQFNLDHRSQLLRVAATVLAEEFKTARNERVGYVPIEEHLVQTFEKLSTEQLLRLSVGELAGKFGCSRRHLNRLFHRHFGFSIVGLRMEMRLLKAVSLLRDPGAKVIHVAEQSGFNHLGLFNTCFRKRFGTSPGQWRKLAAQREGATAELVGTNGHCPMHSNGLCPWLCQTDPLTAGNGAVCQGATGDQASRILGVPGLAKSPGAGLSNGAGTARVAKTPWRVVGPDGSSMPVEELAFPAKAENKSPAAALLERCARL